MTTLGASYTIDFWVANTAFGVNSFSVSWGGVTLLSLTNQARFGYPSIPLPRPLRPPPPRCCSNSKKGMGDSWTTSALILLE